MSETKLKPFPTFSSDEEAERFVDEADLSEYDFSGFEPIRLERSGSTDIYSFELPATLFHRVAAKARQLGITIDAYLIALIERDLGDR